MSTETVDIVIKEAGAAEAAARVEGLGAAAVLAARKVDELNAASADGVQKHQSHSEAVDKDGESMHSAGEAASQLKELLVSLGLAMGIEKWIELTDTFTTMIGRVSQVSDSQRDLADNMRVVLQIANDTRAPMQTMSEMFVTISKNMNNLGIGGEGVKNVIRTIGDAAIMSGKSSAELAGVMKQLSVAFETGQFQGRGLMQLMRELPDLGVALAGSFNRTVKQFETAVQSGQISMQQIIQHILNLQSQMEAGAKKMEVTVGQAWQIMSNQIMYFYGVADAASGKSAALAEVILFLADHVNIVIPVIESLVAALTAYTLVAGGAFAISALLASPFALIAAACAAAALAVLNFGSQIRFSLGGETVSLLGVVAGAFKLVADAAQFLWEHAKDLEPVFFAIGLSVAYLTREFILLVAVNVFEFFVGLLPVVAELGIALAAIAAGVAVAVAAFDVLTGAMEAWRTGSLQAGIDKAKELNDKLLELAVTAKDKVVDAFKDMSAEMNKTGIEAKNMGDTFKDVGAQIQTVAGVGTRAMNQMSQASQEASRKAQQAADQAKEAARLAAEVAAFLATHVENAMGGWVKIMSDWDARSGVYFNNFGNNAKKTASDVESSMSGMAKSIDQVQQMLNKGFSTSGGMGNIDTGFGVGGFSANNPLWGATAAGGDIKSNLKGKLFLDQWNNWGATYGISDSDLSPDQVKAKANKTGFYFANGGSFEVGGAGGVDSQLVQFMATPGEKVSVQTPGQATQGGGRTIVVHMNVNGVSDVNSFRRSQSQIVSRLQSQLARQ